jgi:hypothetical protein
MKRKGMNKLTKILFFSEDEIETILLGNNKYS